VQQVHSIQLFIMQQPKWRHPFVAIIAGNTGSGKSWFLKRFIENIDEMVTPNITLIYYCYGEYQQLYSELQNNDSRVQLHHGPPTISDLQKHKGRRILLCLDDLMIEYGKNNSDLSALFTRFSHHNNCSIIHLVQNIFYGGLRTARVNSQYLVLMRSPSDGLQIQTLARQIYPKNQKFLIEAYDDATTEPFTYLLLDLHQLCDNKLRIRTKIFPTEDQIVYITKK